MARVLFDKVTKSYGDVHVVKELNLEIRDQELLVLVGPSGCGKSTTLRMIAGLEEVTSGRLLIGERVVNDIAPKDRDIAMVFQNYALYPHMSVFENMSFALKLRKLPKADIEQRVREVARTLDLEHLLERKPKQLSGGQRQRVAMGRAIVRNPAVFLFDEPLSNLDAKLRVQMRVEIAKLHKRLKTTIVYVTHDQVEAMTLADRIVVMKDGYVQQVGPPLELYDRPTNAFVAGFIGSPSMNFLRGTLQRHDDALRVQSDAFSIQLSPRAAQSVLPEAVGQEVLLGFRPQALNPLPEGQAPPPHATFTSRVDVVEPMGAETYYYLEIGGVQLVARSEGHTALRAHQEATFAPDLDQLHLFSADGAQRLN